METEPRLGGICTLSYPRLPPSARARGSRPQLQDRKRSGGEGGRGQEAREGPEGGGARRRGRSQEREGPGGEGGGRGGGHKEEEPGGEGGARGGGGQKEREEPGEWSTTLASTHSAHEGTHSLPSGENPSLEAKFLLTLMCGRPPCLSNTLYCFRL